MIAATLATLIAAITFAVGRRSMIKELETGEVPASYYWLLGIVLVVGGPILFMMERTDFMWNLACDLMGMLIGGGILYFGYDFVRPLLSGRKPRQ